MVNSSQFPTFLALIQLVLRLLPIVVSWLAIAALGTGCYLAARGIEQGPLDADLVAFGTSMAVGSAVGAAVALALGRKAKLARNVVLAVALTATITSAVMYALLYADPWTLRNQMDLWSFVDLEGRIRTWVWDFAWFRAPFSAWVGLVIGLVCGLLSLVASRRPRWAVIATLVLLFGLYFGRFQELAWGLLTKPYWTLRSEFAAGSVTSQTTAELGAVFGAFTGAFIAAIAIEMARRKATRASIGLTRHAAGGDGGR